MNRRTRREDERDQKDGFVEFDHLLDAVRGTQLPPPVPPAAEEPEVTAELLVDTEVEFHGDVTSPTATSDQQPVAEVNTPEDDRPTEVNINDDLLPAPRRKRWGRR